MKMLEGKNVIVTGTARGIGHKMVEIFAQNGANVFAHARKETQEHKQFCEQLAVKENVQIIPVYFDLQDEDAIKDAVKSIRSTKLSIDGLVNNAGVTYNALFQMTNMDELRKQFEVNFFAPYLFTQYISKLMIRNKKGSIVNVSSSAALDGNSGKSARVGLGAQAGKGTPEPSAQPNRKQMCFFFKTPTQCHTVRLGGA